jgi:hypothetical protein
MVEKPGTDAIEPTFKLMMIRTYITPSPDVAHFAPRFAGIRSAACTIATMCAARSPPFPDELLEILLPVF